jgi:hypothetical protein
MPDNDTSAQNSAPSSSNESAPTCSRPESDSVYNPAIHGPRVCLDCG